MSEGLKLDDGKLKYDLVDPDAEAEMIAVLTYGSVKYEPENWRRVEGPIERYTAALRRHLAAYLMGEQLDPETGLHHLAHVLCCAHFMLGVEIMGDSELTNTRLERLKFALVTARKIRAERMKAVP